MWWLRSPGNNANNARRSCGYAAVCDFDNLCEAHVRARRGKLHKREAIEFELSLAESLARLRQGLLDQTYGLSGYRHFVVTDPERRDVRALCYRDRVVRHALCDEVLEPVLDPRLVCDSAAGRRGRGTDFALGRLAGFLREHHRRHGAEDYVLEFDVRSCYASVDHSVLKGLFDRYFHYDPRVRWLVGRIIDSCETAPGKGVPLGNQASTWFAVSCLDGLDRLMKERRHVKRYTRYMDDGVVVHRSEGRLGECLGEIREYLRRERGLEPSQKTQIVPLSQGVDYLGFHLCLTDTGRVVRRLRTSSKRRMRGKLKRFGHAYRTGKIDAEDVGRSVQSYQAHLAHGDCWHLEQDLLQHLALSQSTRSELDWDKAHPQA